MFVINIFDEYLLLSSTLFTCRVSNLQETVQHTHTHTHPRTEWDSHIYTAHKAFLSVTTTDSASE